MKTNTNEMENRRREVICLCGSTKFKEEFLETAGRLRLEGKTVLMPLTFSHAEGKKVSEEQAKEFDRRHRGYIDRSDGVYVIDVGGYIGESTRREIDYAIRNEKPVRYYSNEIGGRG